MASRTPEGKHVTRFIVLEKNAEGKYVRSTVLPSYYLTKEEATNAVTALGSVSASFKVRQK